MKVLLDAQVLQTPALNRGMGQYLTSLIAELSKQGGIELTLIMSSKINNQFTVYAKKMLSHYNVAELPLVGSGDTRQTKDAILKNKLVLNDWVRDNNLGDAKFVLGTMFQAEIFPALPDNVATAAIVYDVIPIQFFHQYAPNMKWDDYLDRFSLLYEADKLLCISKTTGNDLQIYANVPSEKISVINGGPGEFTKPRKPKDETPKKFVLMPTGNDIRKNNRLAVEAFSQVNEQLGGEYKLVITSYFTEDEKTKLLSISPDIVFTGVVSSDELSWYFSNCEAVLFPSLYEGLGMPLIEGTLFKKPIVASKIDVFVEISSKLAYYFSPHNKIEMCAALSGALENGISPAQEREAKRVIEEYSWPRTAQRLADVLFNEMENHHLPSYPSKRIAVLGPHVTGASAIGKFIAELHPVLAQYYEIDYYYEKSPVDIVLRPDILGHSASVQPLSGLTFAKLKKYDAIIYHIGNSDHHSLTVARALRFPGIVILHDLHIENVYNDLVKRKLIDQERLDAEKQLDKLLPTKSSYLQSIVYRQKAIIVHSQYAKEVIQKLTASPVLYVDLAVSTPLYDIKESGRVFTIGLAGILAGIKGIAHVERLAQLEEFKNDKIMLFGLNFAEPGTLDKIRQLPNVEVTTDLSDFEFQQSLKQLDLFINFRTRYQGEASYATLEAMRYGIPVIVRGDFGWYSELPDGAVIKVNSESEIVARALEVKHNKKLRENIRNTARSTTKNKFSVEQYVDVLGRAMDE